MSGLLGFMAAGAAKGFAEGRTNEIKQQQEFDLKRALLDAQTEKEMMMQERGIKLKEDAEQRYRDKVTGVVNSVEDQTAGKGGYEDEETKQKREVDLNIQRANKLRESGYFDEAKSYDSIVDQYNKGEISRIKMQNELEKINKNFEVQKERNENLMKIADAKNETQLAKIEAAKAKGGNSKTEAQTKREAFMEAFGDNPEYVKNGKLTAKGYDKLNKIDEKEAFDEVTEKTVETDKYGNPIKERSVKSKVPKSDMKIGRYVPGKGVVFDQYTSGLKHNTLITNRSIVHEAY